MPVRQVQADEVPRRRLREVRRRGDAAEGPARAHGPYRARLAGRAHLVPEEPAVAHRPDARHDAARPRAHPLLRAVCRHRARPDRPQARPADGRGGVPRRPGPLGRGRLPRRHRRRGDPRDAGGDRPRRRGRAAARRPRRGDGRAEAEEDHQAAEAGRVVPRERQPAGVDGADGHPGDPARAAPARPARRRPLRHVRPQRPLPPRHQPEQPPEAADRAACPRHHHPQRKADAAGVGRRALRQRPPRPGHHRHQQAAAEVALRHAQGQAGPLPAEPARQARRLLRPLGDRDRSGAEAAPVRPAEKDGARALQAVHLQPARRQGAVVDRQAGEEARREGAPRGLGHPRRGDPRAPGAPEPRADAAPPRHPGLRAGADRGQGDPASPAGLRRVQRRLRRRPDGRARAAVARSPARGARPDDVDEQRAVALPTASRSSCRART